MIKALFQVCFLLASANGLGTDDKFIDDLLTSPVVDSCDLGFVYDGDKPKITNKMLEAFSER